MMDTNTSRAELAKSNRQRVYEQIVEFFTEYGYNPSERDLAERVPLARSAVHGHIEKLVAEGKLVRMPGHRGVRLP